MIKKHEIQLEVTGLCIDNYNTSFDLAKKGDVNQLNQLGKKDF
jgi:glutathione peroxidase-family protein